MIFINGRFLDQALTGVQRFAGEITACIPQATVLRPQGSRRGQAWEQIDLAPAARAGLLLNLTPGVDMALVVRDEVPYDAVIGQLSADPARLIRSASLFDLYKPGVSVAGMEPGERSMAVRLELLDSDANLTDERIDATVAAALARVQAAFGARLRAKE